MWELPRTRTILVAIIAAVSFLCVPAATHAASRQAPTVPQTYLSAIDWPAEFPALTPVRVAVIDTGVDGNHPDLAGRIVEARGFDGGDPLVPTSPHGTAVAGLIGAVDGNGLGIDGIAPNARLLVANVDGGESQSSFNPTAVARAIRWAADRHARVINLSLAGPGPVPGYQEAIGYALARGALVVAAAGNCFDGDFSRCTPRGSEQAPAWLPHVLTVGATSVTGAPAGFSIPSARWVDLAAPGELVTTLWPTQNNPYLPTPDCMFAGTTGCYSTGGIVTEPWGPSGTSLATAMVSGAAAILFGANPRLRPEQVAALLRETARPVADPRAQVGAGQLDIAAALERVKHGSVPPADYGEPNDRSADATRIGPAATIRGTLDWQDDPADVYRLVLRSGDKVSVNADEAAQGAVSARAVAANCKTRNVSTFLTREFRFLARCPGAYLLRLTAKPGTRVTYRLTILPS